MGGIFRMSAFIIFINHSSRVCSQGKKKEIKCINIQKEKIKPSLFKDDGIVYIKILRNLQKKKLFRTHVQKKEVRPLP